jgi:hypothetical protein
MVALDVGRGGPSQPAAAENIRSAPARAIAVMRIDLILAVPPTLIALDGSLAILFQD